jgi:hypothetical protein
MWAKEKAEAYRRHNHTGHHQNILVGDMSLLWHRLEDK